MNLHVQPADGVSPPRRIEERLGEFWASSWIPGTETLLDHGWYNAPSNGSVSTVVLDGDVSEFVCADVQRAMARRFAELDG